MNRLAEFRKSIGLTQEQLAKEIGLKRSTIQAYENGRRTPPFRIADKIAVYFGVPIELIFPEYQRQSPYPMEPMETPARR